MGWNPYIHTTDFGFFFEGSNNGFDMWYYVNPNMWPNSSDDYDKAARSLVAGYLNASWGVAYAFSIAELHDLWDDAVAGDISFGDLHSMLDKANNAPGGCPISASGF